MDAKEALQYVYCVPLSADQGDIGKEQVETAWEQVRRIIVLGNGGPGWEELVGGYRSDGTRFVSLMHMEWYYISYYYYFISRVVSWNKGQIYFT